MPRLLPLLPFLHPCLSIHLQESLARTLSPAKAEDDGRRAFLWLSDAHVDPLYGTDQGYCYPAELAGGDGGRGFGRRHCDPPMALWLSSLAAAADVGGAARFVLTTGDHVRHFPNLLPGPVTDVLDATATALRRAFPHMADGDFVTGAHGNTDSRWDYELNLTAGTEDNAWLSDIAKTWQRAGILSEDREMPFAKKGFFEAEVGGLRLLMLNTICYSALHSPPEPAPADPFGQFAWLRERLRQAYRENRKVWLVGHIPPGMETYAYSSLWQEQYVAAYRAIVEDKELGSVVAAQLFGHVHAEEFRVLPSAPDGAGPMLLTGSLSPVYNNNPSFRLVEYNASTGALLDMKVYWAPMPGPGEAPKWRLGHSLTGSYPALRPAAEREGGLSNGAFLGLAKELWLSWLAGGPQFSAFAAWYKTGAGNDLQCCERYANALVSMPTKRRYVAKYFCALNVTTDADFERCAEAFSVSSRPRWKQVRRDYEAGRRSHWQSVAAPEELPDPGGLCGHMWATA